MQILTDTQLRTAIEVLTKLTERLDDEAAFSVIQLPDTGLGAQYARGIEARKAEQINRIELVTRQLQNWREELSDRKENASPEPDARLNSTPCAASAWHQAKNFTRARILAKNNGLATKQILMTRE